MWRGVTRCLLYVYVNLIGEFRPSMGEWPICHHEKSHPGDKLIRKKYISSRKRSPCTAQMSKTTNISRDTPIYSGHWCCPGSSAKWFPQVCVIVPVVAKCAYKTISTEGNVTLTLWRIEPNDSGDDLPQDTRHICLACLVLLYPETMLSKCLCMKRKSTRCMLFQKRA